MFLSELCNVLLYNVYLAISDSSEQTLSSSEQTLSSSEQTLSSSEQTLSFLNPF